MTGINRHIVKGMVIILAILLIAAVAGCSRAVSTTVTPRVTAPSTTPASVPGRNNGQPSGALGATIVASPTPEVTPAPTPTPAPSTAVPSTTAPVGSTSLPTPSNTPSFQVSGGTPVILITAPITVSSVTVGSVTVSVVISNFNLAANTGQPNADGEGHIIYYMDATPPIVRSLPATTAAGTWAESTDLSYTWQNVGAGYHYFSAQLVNNDGTSLLPAIRTTVYITAQ